MNLEALNAVAEKLVEPGRGVLAADESTGTIQKRFDAIGVQNTEPNRRAYRELLFRSEGMDAVSGVILFEETLYQDAADGTPMVELITRAGSIPGIKLDQGVQPLAQFPGETVTVGLDTLPDRLAKAYARGARFAKWRAVIDIAEGADGSLPTLGAIRQNAQALARYAALCQAHDIVPIVEPEVLMDGDHDLARCDEVTRLTLTEVFDALADARVALEGMILKPNMVISGMKAPRRAGVEDVARATIAALNATVPAAVPGIAYLSGGQSDEEATAHLDAMVRIGGFPWKMTFSYGRALQAAAQQAWRGKRENIPAAQAAFTHRARMNGLASQGRWEGALERAA